MPFNLGKNAISILAVLKQQVTKHTLFDVFFALWVFTILWPKFSILSFPGFRTGIRLEDILWVCFAVIWLYSLIRGKIKWVKSPINLSVFLYLGVGFIITIIGILVFKTVASPSLGALHALRRVQYFSFFFFALTLLPSIEEAKLAFVSFLDVGLIISGFAFLQLINLWPLYVPLNHPTGTFVFYYQLKAVNGNFGGSYELAAFYVILILFALTLFVYLNKREEVRKITLMTILVSLIPFYFTYGRTSLMGILVAIVFLVVLKNVKLLILPVLFIIFILILFITGNFSRYRKITLSFVKTPDILMQGSFPGGDYKVLSDPTLSILEGHLFGQPFSLKDPSLTTRIAKWPIAFALIKKYPFTGGGYSVFGEGFDNDYLRMVGETGFIGLGFFALLSFTILNFLMKAYKKIANRFVGVAALSIFIVFIGLLTNATLIDTFEASKVAVTFWFLLGLIVKASLLSEPKMHGGLV